MAETIPHRHGPSFLQVLAESFSTLYRLGHRSLLALLGIAVGSAAIVALLNIGSNAADESIRLFNTLGSNLLITAFPLTPRHRQPPRPTLDPQALIRAVPLIADAAPVALQSGRLRYGGRNTDATVVGTTRNLASVMKLEMERGRFLWDFDRTTPFAVVGAHVAEALDPLPLGAALQVEGYLFEVIGIVRSHPANPLIPVAIDDSIFIPIAGMRRIQPAPALSNLIATTPTTRTLDEAVPALRAYLTEEFDGRPIDIQLPQQLIDGLRRQTATFTYLLAGLGGISLFVGGVGIMNVMLMNVTERRREIGVRMALGARPRDIRLLFLLEAANLSIVGAMLGALAGLGLSYAFVRLSGWQFTAHPLSIPLGIGSSLITGVFFGIHPASSAARLRPVQALRDE